LVLADLCWQAEEQFTHNDNQPYHLHKRFELFFFESVGNRNYLRFTQLAVILILCFTIIPLVTIFTLFLYSRASISSEQINVNVRSTAHPDATPLRNVIIQEPTPQPLPKVRRSSLLPLLFFRLNRSGTWMSRFPGKYLSISQQHLHPNKTGNLFNHSFRLLSLTEFL
jgi:hypothetical protein